MRDFGWMIFICALFALLGALFIGLGVQIWIKRRMDLIISAHCDKVSEENKPAYCRLMGIGMILMGGGFCLSGICALFILSARAFIPMTVGLVSGITLLAAAVIRYNR